ncbi:DUF378 domain-containing protein [Candidatus Woesearchaeota archaeon]|nr:DUF378 domain-containing protein [Candidatus Woesearchaeota archaeon]
MAKDTVNTIAKVLLVAGGLNWGLVALGTNVVAMLGATLESIVYGLVGLAAVYKIFKWKG